jgi:hypothetical protein
MPGLRSVGLLVFATVARVRRLVLLACCVLAIAACDRNLEPFDPNEKRASPISRRSSPKALRAPSPRSPGCRPPPGESRGTAGEPSEVAAGGSAAPITGTVELAPEFAGGPRRTRCCFIIARHGAGPPLAVKRIAEPKFPFEFSIGPDDRMIKSMPFAGPIELTARIDGDGNATSRSPGDVMGACPDRAGRARATGVAILLDTPL